MKNFKRRLIALAAVVMLVVGTFPISAFADGDTPAPTEPQAYAVTLDCGSGGTAALSVRKPGQLVSQAAGQAEAGDEVTVNVKPDAGRGIKSVKAVTQSGRELELAKWGDLTNPSASNYVFTMPGEPVDVTVRFVVTYPITLTQSGGSLLAQAHAPSSGAEGDEITVRLVTDPGINNAVLKSVVVKGADGADVPATRSGESFVFTMPAQAVEVKAEVALAPCVLSSITANGGTLVPAFDPAVADYAITVPYETEEIGLAAEDNDHLVIIESEWKPNSLQLTYNSLYPDTIVKADGRIALNVGDNVVHLKASYINGFFDETEYTVTITRLPRAGSDYTVIWLNGDASELDRKSYLEGEAEPTTGKTPTKAAENGNVYTFKGWDAGTVAGTTKTYRPEFTSVHTHDWGKWVVTKEATEAQEGVETRTCSYDTSHVETRVIPKLDPSKASYSNAKGDGSTWIKGSGETLDFTFKRSADDNETFERFTGIRVDGKAVDEASYTAESGSVIIRIGPAYLETLSVGSHTLTADFDDGSAEASFSIAAKKEGAAAAAQQEKNTVATPKAGNPANAGNAAKRATPSTGDAINLAFLLAVMLAATGALAISASRKGRRGE